MTGGCVFCGILAGQQPASVVCEDDIAVAIMDLRQAVPGHVLVLPRVHAETLDLLDEDTAAHLMRVAHRIARAMQRTSAPAGFNLWQSNGEAGGQEVPHVHLHMHPRITNDGLLRIYPAAPSAPARTELDRLATILRDALDLPQARP